MARRSRSGDEGWQCQQHQRTRPPPVIQVEVACDRQVSDHQGHHTQVAEEREALRYRQHAVDNGGVDGGHGDQYWRREVNEVSLRQIVASEAYQRNQQGKDAAVDARHQA